MGMAVTDWNELTIHGLVLTAAGANLTAWRQTTAVLFCPQRLRGAQCPWAEASVGAW